MGDLAEEFRDRIEQGRRFSRLWYWRQSVAISLHFLRERAPESGAGTGDRRGNTRGAGLHAVTLDVRFAVRSFLRRPGFAAVLVLTLALGIGANTTVFSLVNAVLLRPPPGITNPEALVQIGRGETLANFDNYSFPVYRDFVEQAGWFTGVAAFAYRGVIDGSGANRSLILAQIVSDNYFDVLGVEIAKGRAFSPTESAVHEPVAVVSDRWWHQRHGPSVNLAGHTIDLNGRSFDIIGVASPEFGGTQVTRNVTDVWVPIDAAEPLLRGVQQLVAQRSSSWLWTIARLTPDVTFDQAESAMQALQTRLNLANPTPRRQGVMLVRGVSLLPDARQAAETFAYLLTGAAVLVLVIACTNLANLILVRAAARAGEIAVRVALGANRRRIMRQLVIESLLVSLVGGAAAVALTFWTARLLPVALPQALAVAFTPDAKVFLFALGVSVSAALLFGLLPAWKVSRPELVDVLKASNPTTTGARGVLRNAFVIGQLALSFVLLSGSGVLVQSVLAAHRTDPGFDVGNTLALTLRPDLRDGADEPDAAGWRDQLLSRVLAVPGITDGGFAESIPIADFPSNFQISSAEDGSGARQNLLVYFNLVSESFLKTMGFTVVRGRDFESADRRRTDLPVVINETLSNRAWPGLDPIGRRLVNRYTVIGVVRDARMRSLRDAPRPYLFQLLPAAHGGGVSLFLRSSTSPSAIRSSVLHALDEFDPGLPVHRVGSMREHIRGSLAETQSIATIVGVMGGLAVVLATVGLYGVIAVAISQRVREFGIRVALGASTDRLVRWVVIRSTTVAAAGLVMGIGGSVAASGLIRGLLYQVSPVDPVTLGFIAGLFGVLAVLASIIPARRAVRLDPAAVLRDE